MYECEVLEEMSKKLIDMNASQEMDQGSFQAKYDGYVKRYEKESLRIEDLKAEKTERLRKADQLSSFMFEIYEQDGTIDEFDGKLWIATIESVEVQRDGVLLFRFRNGMEVGK